MSLNLARHPFQNLQPVRRAGLLIGLLAVVLAGVNVYLYWQHFSGQGAAESGLRELREQISEETALLEAARTELAGFDSSELNRKIEFVNLRILQRTFSWSRLFDLVAETLPADVRLTSLAPSFEEVGAGRTRVTRTDQASLEIRGEAKSSQALLEFVDRLFGHPAFAQPDLHQEAARPERGAIAFSISVLYLPDAASSELETPPGEAEGGADESETLPESLGDIEPGEEAE